MCLFSQPCHGRFPRRRGAFTLIEIMIVIAIIAVLAAIAIPNFQAARKRAQVRACYANLRSLAGALEYYCADINMDYQISSEADLKPIVDGGHLNATPKCPDGGKYTAQGGGKQAACSIHGSIHPEGTEEPSS